MLSLYSRVRLSAPGAWIGPAKRPGGHFCRFSSRTGDLQVGRHACVRPRQRHIQRGMGRPASPPVGACHQLPTFGAEARSGRGEKGGKQTRRQPPLLSLRRWTSAREEAEEGRLAPAGRRFAATPWTWPPAPPIEPPPWTSSASAHPRDLLLDLRVPGEAVEAAVPLARLVVSSSAPRTGEGGEGEEGLRAPRARRRRPSEGGAARVPCSASPPAARSPAAGVGMEMWERKAERRMTPVAG
jgi:hypothetical protein